MFFDIIRLDFMILTPHILVGAAIGLRMKNPFLVFITAFLSHFVLDAIPHTEYDVSVLKEKPNKKFIAPCLKILVDFVCGLGIVFFISKTILRLEPSYNLVLGIIFSVIPDAFTILFWQTKNKFFKNLTNFHIFHSKRIYPQAKPISKILGILSQVIIGILAIFVF